MRRAVAVVVYGMTWALPSLPVQRPVYFPAVVEYGTNSLNVFTGSARVDIALSAESGALPLRFGPDGKSVYLQPSLPNRFRGLEKVDLASKHLTSLTMAGMGMISYLTFDPGGTIAYATVGGTRGAAGCGAFRIDLDTGAFRQLAGGSVPDCGGVNGPISPDGKRVLARRMGKLAILQIGGGGFVVARKVPEGDESAGKTWMCNCDWSPDGRLISVVRGGEILLIDSDDPNRVRDLGASAGGAVAWSPDSRFLLVLRRQIRCLASLYGQSLDIINVLTGASSIVESSRCAVSSGRLGWLSAELLESE